MLTAKQRELLLFIDQRLKADGISPSFDEMRDALEKQRQELEEKRRRLESGRPLTPEKVSQATKKKGFSLRN